MTFYKNREKFSQLSVKIGIWFSKIPLSPNKWTLISLIPAVLAAYFLARDLFLYSAAWFIVAAFLDLVDGSVARVTGRVSKFGAYLDTIVDRYVEALIILALLFVSLPDTGFYFPIRFWVFLFLFGAMMTTYAKSAAKEKEIVEEGTGLKGGLLERAERLIILFIAIIAAAFDPLYLSYAIVLLAVLANFSALQRIWIARRMTKE